MRLINTQTLELEEFMSEEGLEYAILSHRWATEEVSLTDMQDLDRAQRKKGFIKVKAFCNLVASHGYQYCWVDTCCIDKSSSAELSEAINSMYRWYEQADLCYAYLADVTFKNRALEFKKSNWFTRGWTLQELLAPKDVRFFDREWVDLGSKQQLINEVHYATDIDRAAIESNHQLGIFSVAEKMSWAAGRVTSRPEDMAYSLMGIFDVNMPLLYGEGRKAFVRLQEQIMKDHDDRTLFAWNPPNPVRSWQRIRMAASPDCFRNCQRFTLSNRYSLTRLSSAYALTNRGLSIEVRLWPWLTKTFIALVLPNGGDSFCIVVKAARGLESVDYDRIILEDGNPDFGTLIDRRIVLAANKRLMIRPSITRTICISGLDRREADETRLTFRLHFPEAGPLRIVDVRALCEWDEVRKSLKCDPSQLGTAGIIRLGDGKVTKQWPWHEEPRVMLLGFDFDYNAVCIIANSEGSLELPDDQRFHVMSSTDLPNDISNTRIEDITCFETRGWSESRGSEFAGPVIEGTNGTIMTVRNLFEVAGRPGFWAIKISQQYGCHRCRLGKTNWTLIARVDLHRHWTIELGIQ